MRTPFSIMETKGFLCSDGKTFTDKHDAAEHQRSIWLSEIIMDIARSNSDENRFQDFTREDANYLAEQLILHRGNLEALLALQVEVRS